ncbi:MAG: hypothetical protein R8K20_03970, partial [Gallionellaceae bacterium]
SAITAKAAAVGAGGLALAASNPLTAAALAGTAFAGLVAFGVIKARQQLLTSMAEKSLMNFAKAYPDAGSNIAKAKSAAAKEMQAIKANDKLDKKAKSAANALAYGRYLGHAGGTAINKLAKASKLADKGFKPNGLESLMGHRSTNDTVTKMKKTIRPLYSARNVIAKSLSKGNAQAAGLFVSSLNKAAR